MGLHTNIKTFWNEFILNLNIKALSEVQRSSYTLLPPSKHGSDISGWEHKCLAYASLAYYIFWGDYGLCIPLLWHCFTWSFNSTWWRWRFLDALISYSNVAPKLNHFIPLLQSQTYFIIFLPQNSFRHNMESRFIYLIKYAAPFRLRRNVLKLLESKLFFSVTATCCYFLAFWWWWRLW